MGSRRPFRDIRSTLAVVATVLGEAWARPGFAEGLAPQLSQDDVEARLDDVIALYAQVGATIRDPALREQAAEYPETMSEGQRHLAFLTQAEGVPELRERVDSLRGKTEP